MRFEDERKYVVLVPMDRVRTAIDTSFWAEPFGMEASDSFAVDFTGVRLGWDTRIGQPDAYEESPWLLAVVLLLHCQHDPIRKRQGHSLHAKPGHGEVFRSLA